MRQRASVFLLCLSEQAAIKEAARSTGDIHEGGVRAINLQNRDVRLGHVVEVEH